jgi:hypothetical protein
VTVELNHDEGVTMTALSTTTTTTGRTSPKLRVGLALGALLGAANIPFVFDPTPSGEEGPPFLILLLSAVLGVVTIVAAVIAWRSGNRLAIRIGAAALIVNAVTSLPAFFVDISAWIKLASAVTILLTVVAVVLMLRRENGPVAITD